MNPNNVDVWIQEDEVKWPAEWNQKNVKNYNIYAKRSEAEIFFEHFITKDLNIAPKKYI